MRNCGNCYNGHYNLSDRGEEIYCDESGYMEEKVNEDSSCEYHRYIEGMEEEKNYLYYDESYMAPGFIILNIRNGKIYKFLKLYNTSLNGFPLFGLIANSVDAYEDPDEEFSRIDLSFRDIEDEENGLYKLFTDLCSDLSNEKIYSVDYLAEGKNHFELETNSRVTKITLYKDTYHGSQHPCNYIDILIGDEYTCSNYESMIKLWNGLSKICVNKMSPDDVKKLILVK